MCQIRGCLLYFNLRFLLLYRFWNWYVHEKQELFLRPVDLLVCYPSYVTMRHMYTKILSTLPWPWCHACALRWSPQTPRCQPVYRLCLHCWGMMTHTSLMVHCAASPLSLTGLLMLPWVIDQLTNSITSNCLKMTWLPDFVMRNTHLVTISLSRWYLNW